MTVYIGNFLNSQGEIDEKLKESSIGYDVKIIYLKHAFYYRYRYVKGFGGFAWKIEKVEMPRKIKVQKVNAQVIDVHIGYMTVLMRDFDLEECTKFREETKDARG